MQHGRQPKKNHVNVDRQHKLIRRYHVSNAALHDSQAVDHLLMPSNTGSEYQAETRRERTEPSLTTPPPIPERR